jgi:hypothetical protein
MADEFTYYVTYLMTGQTRYFWKYRLNSVAFQKTKATARVGSAAALDRWAATWWKGDWDHQIALSLARPTYIARHGEGIVATVIEH